MAPASFRTNNFDLLRIFAATQVLIIHSIDRLGLTGFEWLDPLRQIPGVPIFFVLSGYLVSKSFENTPSLRDFFIKRARRIFPGLWGCLVVTVVVAALFGINFLTPMALVWFGSQLLGLIYTPGFLEEFGSGTYNGSLWTLLVELQFYVVTPIVYWLLSKTSKPLFGLLSLVVIFALIAIYSQYAFPQMYDDDGDKLQKMFRYSFVPHVYMFLFGVLLQKAKAYQSSFIVGQGGWWLSLYVVYRLLAPNTPVFEVFGMLLLGASVISVAYTATDLSGRILNGTDISYGVYVYHGLVLNILVELGLVSKPQYLLLVLIGAGIAGYCSWIWIEKPFLKRAKTPVIQPA